MVFDFNAVLKIVPAAIIGLTIHEWAHAWTSYKLGDNTAKEQGRLTLNPIKHIDPLGFILIIIAGFGWAKPVQFNPENLKRKNRDEILISVSGPISNLLVGIAIFAIVRFLYFFPLISRSDTGIAFLNMLVLWAVVNWGLFIFNLIPLPPLDGSHVYMTFLKEFNPVILSQIYRIGTMVLLGIIIAENQMDMSILPITPIIKAMVNGMMKILYFN